MPGRILVIEDDAAIARSVRRLLAHEAYYVADVSSGEAAQALLDRDSAFDLLLLDVALPGQDGYQWCRRLRARGLKQPIIMLTARGSAQDRVSGLRAGADDYVTKPFEPTELLARVEAQLRRSREYSSPREPSAPFRIDGRLSLDPLLRDATLAGRPVHLTRTEYKLLAVLAAQPNEALPQRWLYEQIWGIGSDSALKVLAVTIRRIRLKIEPDPDHPQYLQTVRGFGYRLQADTPAGEGGDRGNGDSVDGRDGD